MEHAPFLEEVIKERVRKYLEQVDLNQDMSSPGQMKKFVESPEFQTFRRNLLRELFEMVQSRAEMVDDDEETLTIAPQTPPQQATRTSQTSHPFSGFDSTISSSIIQNMEYLHPTQSQLTSLAQCLNPRSYPILRRREALRQILGMPSFETQIRDAWTAASDTLSEGKKNNSRQCLEENPSTYGMRQGLHDALLDEDAELHVGKGAQIAELLPESKFLALKFIAKALASNGPDVKKCYVLLVEYLEEMFTSDRCQVPLLADGLDISDSSVERMLRAFSLLHEFHKKLPNYWLRYSEQVTETLMDHCLSLLATGWSAFARAHSSSSNRRPTPLHFFGLLDPTAQWFSLWMRGAYGCRPMLARLVANKQLVARWMSTCVRVFLRKPAPPQVSARPCVYTSSQLEAAHFLHSLHAVTTLLGFRETHSDLLPVDISKDVHQDKCAPIEAKSLTARGFTKLLIAFVLSLEQCDASDDAGAPRLCGMVARCVQSLASCPVASVPCFGLAHEGPTAAVPRRRKKTSSGPLGAREQEQTALDSLLHHIQAFVDDLAQQMNELPTGPMTSGNIAVLSRVLANLCSTTQGRAYFNHPRGSGRVQKMTRIFCLYLEIISGDKLPLLHSDDGPFAHNLASIVEDLCLAMSRIHFPPQSWRLRGDSATPRKVLETWKTLRNKLQEKRDRQVSVVEKLANSLEPFLWVSLKTPRGVELARRLGLLDDCVHHLLSSPNRIASPLEADLLVSQVTACAEGFRGSRKAGFVEQRFSEVWNLLEGCGRENAALPEGDEGVQTHTDDVAQEVDCLGREALTPDDLVDDAIKTPFNRLLNVFVHFPALLEALTEAPTRTEPPALSHSAPKTLSAFIDRAVMLDSGTKLAQLCRPDVTLIVGLRFVSVLVSSLDVLLLLEDRFGLRSMLLNAQLRSSMEEEEEATENGRFLIDEGVIERNRLLVKCSVLGGPDERLLPPRCLCEHNPNPYPFPIVTTLNPGVLAAFTDGKKKLCDRPPCVGAPVSTVKQAGSSAFFSVVVGSLRLPSGTPSRAEGQALFKTPRLQARIRSLVKFLPQMSNSTPDVGNLFEACLRAFHSRSQAATATFSSAPATALIPAWKDIALNLIIDYGRRVHVLDETAAYDTQKQELADLLSKTGTSKAVNRGPRMNASGEGFETFDWFVAFIFLLFNGSVSRAADFLLSFRNTRLARYLWSSSAAETPSQYDCALCHTFESVLACELPQAYNTFRMSGYAASGVLRRWLRQSFLNYLNWVEIQDFYLLCLVCGPEMIVYSAAAIMRHLTPRLIVALRGQTHLSAMLEEPIRGFRLVDHLVFLESVADKYNDEVSAELAAPSSSSSSFSSSTN